jgi:hypothetical protein
MAVTGTAGKVTSHNPHQSTISQDENPNQHFFYFKDLVVHSFERRKFGGFAAACAAPAGERCAGAERS